MGAQRETSSAHYILHSMRERERERERERTLFWGRGTKKKKKIDAHIHKIPDMNTWQFYKLAHDISFAHQISCTYSKEKNLIIYSSLN